MEGPWLVSYIVLWILVVALSILVLSQSRLIGLLYQRIGPGVARSLAEGPTVGSRFSEIEGTTLLGQPWKHSFPSMKDLVAIFVSPQCTACNELIPHVKDFIARHGSSVDVKLLSVLGDPAMNRAYADFASLSNTPYLIADRLATRMGVHGTPYAVKLDNNGVVLAGGVTNNFEHLLSLWKVAAPSETSLEAEHHVSEDVIA